MRRAVLVAITVILTTLIAWFWKMPPFGESSGLHGELFLIFVGIYFVIAVSVNWVIARDEKRKK